MIRLPNWRSAMSAYVDASRRRAFEPGGFDCALFFAGAVEAMTGLDPAAGFRGRYSTLAGGQRLLKKAGFANHVDMASKSLREIHPSQAAIGDGAAFELDGGWSLGLVNGERVFVLMPETGLGTLGLLDAKRAFRVG